MIEAIGTIGLALAGAPGTGPPAQAAEATVRVHLVAREGPLRGTIRGGSVAARSDDEGRATIRRPAGRTWIVAIAIGYRPDSLELDLRAGQDTVVSLRLEAAPAELEEITVSSTRSERRIEDEPIRVEVLGREEIEEKLLMTPGDITMMLNETGGLRIQNTSPSLGGANVRVQGLRGRYTLMLADGLPLYGGQVGGLGLLQIPPMDLGQVEVIKGAASALYGSSAMGGVVNLLSRRPDGGREVLFNATSLGGADLVGWMTGPPGAGLTYTLLASAHRQPRGDRDGDGWTDVPGYRRLVARPRLFWQDRSGRSLFLTAGLTREGREGGTLPRRAAPDGSIFAEELETTRTDLGSVGRFPLGSRWLLTTRASAARLSHRHQIGTELERDRHDTWFAEAALMRGAGRWVAVAGLGVQGERYRNRDLAAFDYAFTVPGIFGQYEWTPVPALTLAASARLDQHDGYGTFVLPRLSALWRFRPSWTARLSAGLGYYAPTPFTEETEVTGLSRLEPVAGVRAEEARSAALHVGWAAGQLEANATLFGSVVEGAVQLVSLASAGRFGLVNAARPTRTWGGELLARLRREPWQLAASYTYAEAREPEPGTTTRREVPLTPRHALGIVGSWEREGRTRMGVELYYTGPQALDDNPYRSRSRPYLVVGGLAEHRVGGVRLFLNLENLTNVRQTGFDPLVRPTRAPNGRWTTDAWAPLEGRVINGGLRWWP
jgi:iron complex outermembrane receptor protein